MNQFTPNDTKAVTIIEGLNEDAYPEAFSKAPVKEGQAKESAIKESHDDLLSFLIKKLASDTNRNLRITRYARMDRIITTWQKLSVEDSKRRQKQDATGKAQATSMNLPLVHTHVDDMVAFFAEVYSPSDGSFFATPQQLEAVQGLKDLVELMNEHAESTSYYVELCKSLRALLKYNIGGFKNEWLVEDSGNDTGREGEGVNAATSLDMYNTLWDPSVTNPGDLRTKGEWVAEAEVVNRMHLIRGEQAGDYAGTMCVLDNEEDDTTRKAQARYYRYPPIEAGVTSTDEESATVSHAASVDWSQYNKSLSADQIELKSGYEVVNMYCWLNPAQFGLTHEALLYPADGYFLWRFKILGGERIIMAEPVNDESDDIRNQGQVVIPWYIGLLNIDDMKEASRSIAELLGPFQNHSSFLMNAQVQGARSSIWGIKTIDGSMFDADALDQGEGVTVTLKSKQPGRDVRSGYQEVKGTYDGSKTMDQVGALMSLAQQFFPAQALPSQVASIDRATTNQVAAVMQGVSKRLHMLVRVADKHIFSPLRFDQYRNIVKAELVQSIKGVSDKKVRKALGSGLEQLNREIAEASIRQLLFALIQNPQALQQYDITSIFNYWASMQKMPIDLNQFKLQERTAPPPAMQEGAPPNGVPAA